VRATWQRQVPAVLGLCLLILPPVWLVSGRSTTLRPLYPVGLVIPTSKRSSSAEARGAAWQGWLRAQATMSRECEALEAWDPQVSMAVGDAALRRQLLAADRSGDLCWAHMQAQTAAALARTPEETYQATVLLARIKCDAGEHEAEMEQARRLMALAPRRRASVMVLWRAARCNGLASVERQADLALQTLGDAAPMRSIGSVAGTRGAGHIGTSQVPR
jgi:hypothetical protein